MILSGVQISDNTSDAAAGNLNVNPGANLTLVACTVSGNSPWGRGAQPVLQHPGQRRA